MPHTIGGVEDGLAPWTENESVKQLPARDDPRSSATIDPATCPKILVTSLAALALGLEITSLV